MFFRQGMKTPELTFNVKLSGLDVAATRFYIDIDGQHFAVRSGMESTGAAVWPGPEKGSVARAAFEDKVAAPDWIPVDGPWAWFKLIDRARPPSEQARPEADLFSVLSLHTNYHQALVTIEASDEARNPFANHDWRRFRCEP
jgi:type VI secretion system protein ImpL